MKTEKLVILDFSTFTVHVYTIDASLNADEEYIKNLGFNTDNCSWMFAEDINIEFHSEILK